MRRDPPRAPRAGRLPDRDQVHFQKKKIVVLVMTGVLVLLLVGLLLVSMTPA